MVICIAAGMVTGVVGRGSSCLELNLDDFDRAAFSSMRLALSGVEFDDFDRAAFSPMRLELSGVEFGRF